MFNPKSIKLLKNSQVNPMKLLYSSHHEQILSSVSPPLLYTFANILLLLTNRY